MHNEASSSERTFNDQVSPPPAPPLPPPLQYKVPTEYRRLQQKKAGGCLASIGKDRVNEMDTQPQPFEAKWYFFYGSLQSLALLKRLLSLSEDEPLNLIPASLVDSELRLARWGSYLTLVPRSKKLLGNTDLDEQSHSQTLLRIQPLEDDEDKVKQPIFGSAYFINCATHAQKLQRYETGAYVPANCRIQLYSECNGQTGFDTLRFSSPPGEGLSKPWEDSITTEIVDGKVFVCADDQEVGRKQQADIDRWENAMGMAWPLRKRVRQQSDY